MFMVDINFLILLATSTKTRNILGKTEKKELLEQELNT